MQSLPFSSGCLTISTLTLPASVVKRQNTKEAKQRIESNEKLPKQTRFQRKIACVLFLPGAFSLSLRNGLKLLFICVKATIFPHLFAFLYILETILLFACVYHCKSFFFVAIMELLFTNASECVFCFVRK